MKTSETGIVKQGNASFGKALVKAGAEANRECLQKSVVGHVQEILMQIEKQRDYIKQSELNVSLLEAKIEALEKGKFTLSNYGVITFLDDRLNKATMHMLECVNCGYPAGGRRHNIQIADFYR